MRKGANPRRHRLVEHEPSGQAQCHEPAASLRHGRRAGAPRSRRGRPGRGCQRRGRQFQRRTGPAEILPRARTQPAGAEEGRGRRQPLALGSAPELRQADHRHDPGLLRRRRVHAALGLRFRHRRRGRHLFIVRGELGHSAWRARLQGCGRRGAAAPCAVLRLPRRAV